MEASRLQKMCSNVKNIELTGRDQTSKTPESQKSCKVTYYDIIRSSSSFLNSLSKLIVNYGRL